MIDTGTRVRVGPTHRYHGSTGIVAEVSGEHDCGDPRANPYRVEFDRATGSGLKGLWFSAADLVVMP